jgi:type I restriction enzyme S subunit
MFGDPVTNPREWPPNNLSSLGKLERGISKHRPRNAPELLGGPYPLIQTGDVARSEGLITQYSSTYSDTGLRQSRLWPAGTLCITIAANIAKTGVLAFDACFPDSVVGFTANPVTTTYVQAWLAFLQPTLERLAPESAQKNINLATLRHLPVPTPPQQQQVVFADTVELIRAARRLHATSLTQLDTLFASLQHRAFNGEL